MAKIVDEQNKDDPLYQIGDKLHFYHPTMECDKSLLQLKHVVMDDNKDNDTIKPCYGERSRM